MIAAAVLVILGFTAAVEAASTPHPALAQKSQLAPPWTKVDRSLRESVAGGTASVRGQVSALNTVQKDAGGRVHLSVYVSSLTEEQRALLRARGLAITFEGARFGFVEGWAALENVAALAALDFVTTVRPVAPPMTNTGSVTSQGDAIHRADLARQTYGVTGAGVKVGVISDSVDGLGTAVASGDLPADVQVLQAGTGAGEGTAMLEIVHDLAPGSPLSFYGPSSSGDMVAGITQLAANGASIIVDDLWFFDQPIYEEGAIAQTVNQQVARNVVYATSAVNSAKKHYGSTFSTSGGQPPQHLFAPGATRQSITVQPGPARILLYWADQWGRSGNDYDLYLVDGGDNIIARGDTTQDGDDLPFETISVDNNTGGPAQAFIVIQLYNGSAKRFDVYYNNVTDIQFGSAVSSIPGHANASGAISVAAANADNPSVIADYSSQGPVNIVFPVLETRAKPDITGVAGVAVTGAAGFSNPFFGTSAAAPHIGALAALVRQANPALSATQVKQTLMATAADLGAAGFDYIFGAGGADAVSAVAAALPPVTTTTLPPPVDPCAGQRIPKPLVKKLRKATAALGAGNLKRAGALFRQARKLANSYTRGKRPKLTTACAQALGGTGL
jgi:hypothetical protein